MWYKNFYIRRDFLGFIAWSRKDNGYIRSRTLEYMYYLIDSGNYQLYYQ